MSSHELSSILSQRTVAAILYQLSHSWRASQVISDADFPPSLDDAHVLQVLADLMSLGIVMLYLNSHLLT